MAINAPPFGHPPFRDLDLPAFSVAAMFANNRLVDALSLPDRDRLTPHLEPVSLPLRFVLESADEPIEYAYFIESGIGSVVAIGARGSRVEVGLIGREGMSAAAVVLGSDRSPHETVVQYPGAGLRIEIGRLKAAMDESPPIRSMFAKYAFALSVQTAQTVLATGRQILGGRLARWILMRQDRLRTDDVGVTHDYIATMLGVRRAGVTIAIQGLETKALVTGTRGNIRVLDRPGLIVMAGEFYGKPEAEYERLFA